MLIEWLRHLTTSCPPRRKRMGYLKELIAMDARHRRCRDAWAPHLEHCKNLILEAAENIPHNRVTVLGSGLLLDIPLEQLAERFDEVVLVDILHLPAASRRARMLANVRLVSSDLSGVADATWDHVLENRAGPLPAPDTGTGTGSALCADSDLVVSANLLSQLPLAPMGWVRGYSEDEVHAFARAIIDHHLSFLGRLGARVCLLTESARQIMDGDEILQEIDPLFGATLPLSGLKWNWNIAPRPEIKPSIDLRFRMTGIPDFRVAGG